MRRVLIPMLGLAVSILASVELASAQVANNIVYAEGYCSGGSGTATEPWTSDSGTGCVQEALTACVTLSPNSAVGGCRVVLPKGYIKVTNTIDTSCWAPSGTCGPSDHYTKHGLVISGHGPAIMGSDGCSALTGSTFIWAGATAGTVLKIDRSTFSVFENFSVIGHLLPPRPPCPLAPRSPFGGTKASLGIEITTSDPDAIIEKVILRNIHVENIDGDPGVGIRVGVADPARVTSPQIDSITIEGVTVRRAKIGAEQNGRETTNVHWQNCAFENFTEAGMVFWGADVHVRDTSFISPENPPSGAESRRADVRMHSTDVLGKTWRPLSALFEGNVHETYRGAAYLFCDGSMCGTGDDGAARTEPTTFVQTRVLWHSDSPPRPGLIDRPAAENKIIDYHHGGPLNLLGCTLELGDGTPASTEARVEVDIPDIFFPADIQTTVTSLGNFYEKWTSGAKVKMFFQGHAKLIANDNPFQLDQAPLNSKGPSWHKDDGLVLEGGSVNWKQAGDLATAPIKFKQWLDTSNNLTITDGSDRAIASWTDIGELKLQKSTARLSFQQTSLRASSPATRALVTIPSVNGTVLLESAAQPLNNKDLTGPGNVFPALGVLSFHGAGPISGDDYFGPGGAVDPATESNVQTVVPAMVVTRLTCFSSVALTTTKKWEVRLRKGGASPSDVMGPCTLDLSKQTCTVAGSVAYNGTSDRLSLRVTGTNNPSGRVSCSASVGF